MYKVLIVDDEQWARKIIKTVGEWEKMECEVVAEASSPNEAFSILTRHHIDIMITDMRMPGMEPVDFLKEISHRYSNLKTIIISGHNDIDYLKQAINSKVVDYILKPVKVSEFNRALQKAIDEVQLYRNQRKESMTSRPIFDDKADSQKYNLYRNRMIQALYDFNTQGVLNECSSIKELINNLGVYFSIRQKRFLFEDLYSMLDIVNYDIQNTKVIDDDMSVGSLFSELEQHFIIAIEHFRSKEKKILDIKEVVRYVDMYFKKDISLELVSNVFFVNKSYLSRMFKEETGKTVGNYIMDKRMVLAKEKLIENKISIKQVSNFIGYDDVSYFYRIFKRYYGITPKELQLRK